MRLSKSKLIPNKTIKIGGSKSISNRLLILQKLFENIEISNLSTSEDTELLQKALKSGEEIIDIHHAGTAMRFLTSYFAIIEGKTTILTGSERMKQRPIGFLVDALRSLGAEIEYLGNEGYPPLKISGNKITKNSVEIPADISSQFITSLLLIAAKLENGLQIKLLGEITSRPYLEMTLKILEEIGIETSFEGNTITVKPFVQKPKAKSQNPKAITVESDWSSASYWYSLVAIGKEKINLKAFKKDSLQGDNALVWIYEKYFGVKTEFVTEDEISLTPIENYTKPEKIEINMNNCPDIVQTLCVTATAMKIPYNILGLSTLKVKETDRLSALKNELNKIGCKTEITRNTIKSLQFIDPDNKIYIKTYSDHRMAMSFAPYCLVQKLIIENREVVEKSYPEFWNCLLKSLKKIT